MSFIKDHRGGSLLEYGIIASLIAAAAITGMTNVKNSESARCPGNNLQTTAPAQLGSAGTPPG